MCQLEVKTEAKNILYFYVQGWRLFKLNSWRLARTNKKVRKCYFYRLSFRTKNLILQRVYLLDYNCLISIYFLNPIFYFLKEAIVSLDSSWIYTWELLKRLMVGSFFFFIYELKQVVSFNFIKFFLRIEIKLNWRYKIPSTMPVLLHLNWVSRSRWH